MQTGLVCILFGGCWVGVGEGDNLHAWPLHAPMYLPDLHSNTECWNQSVQFKMLAWNKTFFWIKWEKNISLCHWVVPLTGSLHPFFGTKAYHDIGSISVYIFLWCLYFSPISVYILLCCLHFSPISHFDCWGKVRQNLRGGNQSEPKSRQFVFRQHPQRSCQHINTRINQVWYKCRLNGQVQRVF